MGWDGIGGLAGFMLFAFVGAVLRRPLVTACGRFTAGEVRDNDAVNGSRPIASVGVQLLSTSVLFIHFGRFPDWTGLPTEWTSTWRELTHRYIPSSPSNAHFLSTFLSYVVVGTIKR